MRRICQVFRSSRRSEMYLYVDRVRGLMDVPEALLQRFGEPRPVMVLALDAERHLARVRATDVLKAIEQHGFFLQMPPAEPTKEERQLGSIDD